MTTIYAYTIPIEPGFDQLKALIVQMPAGAVILSAGFAGSRPYELRVWARVPTKLSTPVPYKFYVIGTGRGFPPDDGLKLTLVSMVVTPAQEVFHVFVDEKALARARREAEEETR